MDPIEKCIALMEDLRVALRLGWLDGQDLGCRCNFCGETAEYSAEARGYLCEHDPECLMVKHAGLVGNVNDPTED